jgi:hypothetical protein
MRHALLLTTALATPLPSAAQTWTSLTGSNGTPYDVLVLDVPGNAAPLVLLDDPAAGQVWYFDQSGFGQLMPGTSAVPVDRPLPLILQTTQAPVSASQGPASSAAQPSPSGGSDTGLWCKRRERKAMLVS